MNTAIAYTAAPTIAPDQVSVLALTVFFMPVITFMVLFFAGKHIPAFIRSWLATTVTAVMFVLSVYIHCVSEGVHLSRWTWFEIGTIQFTNSILINSYSTTMMIIVTFVALMVHIYSVEYMRERRNHSKYFPYLALFISAMLGIVLSDTLMITFIFWELVGLASFLLIGFWYEKDSAAAAAKKAFLFNRVADLGFVIAIMILYAVYGTTELSVIREVTDISEWIEVSVWSLPVMAGFCIWIATVGKSAQFPLYVWLPDAMEGPTPVSALLHAATMVAAGVFLLLKVSFLLGGWVSNVIVITGCITALFAAMQAIKTFDSKKVLAFSTVSQLGYMMMAVGVGANDAAFFHLATHAFFKACLFLSVGAVIHAMHHLHHHQFKHGHYDTHNALDMRFMGNFRSKMPIAFTAYCISYAALIGLPLFSGFLSKDAILIAVYNCASEAGTWHWLIIGAALVTVAVTAFYMTRQLYLIFFGEFRLKHVNEHYKASFEALKEYDWKINLPLILLGILSLWFFFSINPLHATGGWWMKGTVSAEHTPVNWFIPAIAFGFTISAIFFARKKFRKLNDMELRSDKWAELFEHNYYIDKSIRFLFTAPVLKVAHGAQMLDRYIDKAIHLKVYAVIVLSHTVNLWDIFIVDGVVHFVASFSRGIGNYFRSYLKGEVQGYFYFTLLAFILILLWFAWYQPAI